VPSHFQEIQTKPLCAGAPATRTIGIAFRCHQGSPHRLSKLRNDDIDAWIDQVVSKPDVLSFALAKSLQASTEGVS